MKLTPVLTFVVDGVPVAQPRQKHAVRHTQSGPVAVNYLERTNSVHTYKALLIYTATAAMRRHKLKVLDGPILLSLAFYLPRPKRLCRPGDPDDAVWHMAKPDLDNLAKSTKDALKAIVWRDDAAVCGYVWPFGKWYHEKTGHPRVEVGVYTTGG